MIEAILSNFQGVILFIIFLGILITVHEWGHFITAKKLGVKVEEFALGFGHTLFSKVYHGTTYFIKLLPLGGYVKMAGDERDKCKGEPDEFYSKPVGHRALIVVNGPIVNFILAYVCLVLVFMLGYLNPDPKVVGLKSGSPAQIMGIKSGDIIKEIDGKKVYYWKEIKSAIRKTPRGFVVLKLSRDGQEMNQSMALEMAEEPNELGRPEVVKTIGLDDHSATIGWIGKDEPAEKAGLKVKDLVLEVNGKPVFGWNDMQQSVRTSEGKLIVVKVNREGQILQFNVEPRVIERADSSGKKNKVSVIGVGPTAVELTAHRFGLFSSLKRAAFEFVEMTVLTYQALYSMVVGKMSAKEGVGGPVLIYSIVADSATRGVAYFIFILGVISLNLAIFNLLPIIPLDGGHLFLMGIEKLRGKALSPKIDEAIARVGFALIILLAVYVFYVDFERIGLIDKIKSIFS